jgi:UbiD family decarboxylase
VAIKQMYPGHAKQAGLIASQCHAGAYANKYVVVVDDDINPAHMNEVIWAMCTRVDAREDVEILRGCWSTALDPTSYPSEERMFNSRMVIDACRPWARREQFPKVARSSKELDQRIKAKWAHVLPRT